MSGRTGSVDGSLSLARAQVRALGIAEGFFDAQVLFVLNELGVFERLAAGPCLLETMAQATGAAADGLERLLNAGVALTLLELVEGWYANAELSDRVLVPGRPGYLGNWLRLLSRYQRMWTDLGEAVRTGRAVEDPARYLGGDPEATRDFTLAMDDYARLRGAEVIRHLDVPEGARILDLAGGSGSYAILFARTWPGVHVTVFDLPAVARIAEANIRRADLSSRVAVAAGDFYRDDVGRDFDLVFLSDALHQLDPANSEAILRRARRALRRGGRIVVQAMFLNEDRVSPRWPTILSLIMLTMYGSGRAYTVQETVDLLEKAGFANCEHRRMSLVEVNSLILAENPGQPDPGR